MSCLQHVGLIVTDLEKSLFFYKEYLGFQLKERWINPKNRAKIALLEKEGLTYEMIEYIENPYKNSGPYNHLAISVGNLEEKMTELLKKEVKMMDSQPRFVMGGRAKIAFCYGPDNEMIELHQQLIQDTITNEMKPLMTAIIAGRLIDGISNQVKKNQVIVIAQGKIFGIFRREDATAVLADADNVVDASQKTVMPGLINGHCHLCFSASDKPVEDIFSDSEIMLAMRSQQHCAEALAVGVTTVRDCGSTGKVVLILRNAIEKGIVKGSRIVTCGRPITSTGGHCYFLGGETDGIEGVRHLSREILKEGADFLKVMVSGGNMTPGSGPNITQFGEKELQVIAEEAHMHGKKLSVHVHSASSIRDSFEAGADIFDHCSWKKGDDTAYDPELVARMAKKGTHLCPALGAPYRMDPTQWFADKPEKIDFWKRFREQRFTLTRRMIADGMPVIAGDDAGCRMTKFYDYAQGLQLMKRELGLTSMQVLQSATSIAASAMKMENKIGAVRVGLEADLLIVTGNPDENLDSLACPDMVIQHGRIVAREGKLILQEELG